MRGTQARKKKDSRWTPALRQDRRESLPLAYTQDQRESRPQHMIAAPLAHTHLTRPVLTTLDPGLPIKYRPPLGVNLKDSEPSASAACPTAATRLAFGAALGPCSLSPTAAPVPPTGRSPWPAKKPKIPVVKSDKPVANPWAETSKRERDRAGTRVLD